MNDKELALLQQMITTVGENATATVDAYVWWFVVAALAWIAVGIGFFVGARAVWKSIKPEAEYAILLRIAVGVMCFVGSLFVATNLPDLAAPRAKAVHQLIKDIVPG
jgi:hypothetical protein